MDFSKTIIRRLAPAAAALVVFFVVSAAYFAPQFRGEVLPQHDVVQYEGMAKDISDMRAATGEDPQWTGSSFSGMPSYMIDFKVPAWLIRHASKLPVRAMGEPAVLIFTAMLCFWLMTLLWKVNPWVGIVPALAYGFSTYTILIIGAGHISKVWAMAYIPLLIGAIVYTYRGRHLWFGAALAALAAACEGESLITGTSRLAHKESDRAETLREEYAKVGIEIDLSTPDVMRIRGGAIRPARVFSHGDHRIAMSMAVSALRSSGAITIEGAEAVAKSYPRFFEDLESLRVN